MIESYKDFKKFLESIDPSNKPKLLLHTCCAPCSTHTIMLLKDYFQVTIFYSNDNIYPKDEYDTRMDEQIRFATNLGIDVLYDTYKHEDFNQAILGKELLGEKSSRAWV